MTRANRQHDDGGRRRIANSAMLTKVYFPRLVIPASAIAVAFVDFLLSLGLLLGLMLAYGYWPTWRWATLPFYAALCVTATLGAGLWFSALSARYRDFRYVVPFVVQFGLYASPIGFGSSLIPHPWRLLYSLNPLVGVIEGFRWALLRDSFSFDPLALALSMTTTAVLLSSGIAYFRFTERVLADVI